MGEKGDGKDKDSMEREHFGKSEGGTLGGSSGWSQLKERGEADRHL